MTLNSSEVAAGDIITAAQAQNIRLDILQQAGEYRASTGSSNAYVLADDAQISSLVEGQTVVFKANFTNTGAATLAFGAAAAKNIKVYDTGGIRDVIAGEIQSGGVYIGKYDGTQFIISSLFKKELINLFTFGEAVDGTTTPQAVYLSSSDGKVYKTDSNAADTEATFKFVGFVTGSYALDDIGVVITAGEVTGFSGLTASADYYISDTAGSISSTPSTTTIYKIAKATSTTTIRIERGQKFYQNNFSLTKAADGTSGSEISTQDLGFKPEYIEFHYYIQGHNPASGSADYERHTGICLFRGTTHVRDHRIGKQNGGGDNASVTTVNIQLDDTNAPSVGGASGSSAIQATLGVGSITDTGFDVKLNYASNTANGNVARLKGFFIARA